MEVKIEDIPETMLNLVDIIGIEKLLDISKLYGGDIIYIPYYKTLIKKARDREIISKYNGYNAKELAKTYGLSHWCIRKIVQ